MSTTSLKRKPVPAPESHGQTPTTASNESDCHVVVVDKIEGDSKPLPPFPPATTRGTSGWISSQLLSARDRWQRTSRRRRWIFGAVVLASVLALAIGLGVGLRKKQGGKKKYDYMAATHQGDLTYYDPGLGACGITSTNKDLICALSYHLFDAASVGPNPNANPLCGRKLWFTRSGGGERVVVEVVDRCPGCQGEGDLDVSEAAFTKVADLAEGRVGMEWGWID
ncbi:MAG: hypothetical protein M1813_008037 [Trichoglossum hirsutum]|nr:MAG: hypothetical protein M1813_008037 [Trichoglossum hirsutum]